MKGWAVIVGILIFGMIFSSGCTQTASSPSTSTTTSIVKDETTTIIPTSTIEKVASASEITSTVIPTIASSTQWKHPDIPGYNKYENQTFHFRLQYPKDYPLKEDIIKHAWGNDTIIFHNYYFTYGSALNRETKLNGIIITVWHPRVKEDYQYWDATGLGYLSKKPIVIDGVKGENTTSSFRYKHAISKIGIQTDEYVYIIAVDLPDQHSRNMLDSFEFIDTPINEHRDLSENVQRM